MSQGGWEVELEGGDGHKDRREGLVLLVSGEGFSGSHEVETWG